MYLWNECFFVLLFFLINTQANKVDQFLGGFMHISNLLWNIKGFSYCLINEFSEAINKTYNYHHFLAIFIPKFCQSFNKFLLRGYT